jgi:hypothetical protein
MVGAGTKNSDNTFTGFLMGDIGKAESTDDYETTTEKRTGLFGFDEGIQTFALRADGSGVIGSTSQGGGIEFDGTSAII